ncbi:D-isomer specific 2-hydroxyacid dehydrogenase family protein [Bradyrhizobium sp. SZCCHNRI20481]|uniref:D-isomer specific 2-hydroxyacid dehydrogenase family protein n=1 Tax=Bradyrhizobium sp. SZCCHNRI20481 TaxID=3057286 RepID=UPI0029160034|nr:D-isomer specific 2-hydroxyacid dehydrogenase family protein [Bradyrhizobium sp. SZCCHNRI20481]
MLIAMQGIYDPLLRERLSQHPRGLEIGTFAEVKSERRLAQIEILVTRSNLTLNADLIDRLPALRLVVKAGSGTDNIDVDRLAARNVRVIATGGSERSVAELAIGLCLACLRHIPLHDRALRAGSWGSKSAFVGRLLQGQRLGIIGFGRIGRETAALAHRLGMTVMAFDRSPDRPEKQQAAEQLGAMLWSDLALMTTHCDIVSLHLPLVPGAPPIVSKEVLEAMPAHGVLINTSRAAHVDRAALFAALRAGRIAGAGLDVQYDEGGSGDIDLISLENVVSLPHVGAQTTETLRAIAERVVSIITEYLAEQVEVET